MSDRFYTALVLKAMHQYIVVSYHRNCFGYIFNPTSLTDWFTSGIGFYGFTSLSHTCQIGLTIKLFTSTLAKGSAQEVILFT